jgi:hypothetical protein
MKAQRNSAVIIDDYDVKGRLTAEVQRKEHGVQALACFLDKVQSRNKLRLDLHALTKNLTQAKNKEAIDDNNSFYCKILFDELAGHRIFTCDTTKALAGLFHSD